MSDRKSDDRRFGFGDNWLDFARDLSTDQIVEAERSVRKLLRRDSLVGASFVDIGSGSGLFSLAARRLGARVHSFDYDMASVFCTQRLRDLHFPGDRDWTVERGSVLDHDYLGRLGTFDIVYSWGVLHHTGALCDALCAASRLVAPGGVFAFALYHRTRMCGLWRLEKRWYAGASPEAQRRARAIYVALLRLRFRLTGGDFQSYVENYQSRRGMDFEHDVHDWMGGYPYESILASEVEALIQRLGFTHVESTTNPSSIGFFGSGCDEYLYRRAC
jgi:2-polyprenyl-6-hydroxyphenyl methylase/3-demethylubiquinone-9 3-methyltransferase